LPTTIAKPGDQARDLQAHHHDYGRPRDVIFVCRRHHEEVHHIGVLPLKRGGFTVPVTASFMPTVASGSNIRLPLALCAPKTA
jgi:hypothetical protein